MSEQTEPIINLEPMAIAEMAGRLVMIRNSRLSKQENDIVGAAAAMLFALAKRDYQSEVAK